MPRGYRPAQAASLVRHNHGMFVANPHDDENDLLAASARALNPEKITAEHYAGYYAFAGIIQRGIAARLHQHYVTWDDLNDYCGLGVGTNDYNLMEVLSINGLKPAGLRRWQQGLNTKDTVPARTILKLFTLGVSIPEVNAYLKAGATIDDIPALFNDYKMSVPQAVRYFARPRTSGQIPLQRALAAMTAKARNRELACELVACHVPPALASGWNVHCDALGVDQCCALIRAGFSAQEVTDHPDLGQTPRDLLDIQAALADLTPTVYPNSLALARV